MTHIEIIDLGLNNIASVANSFSKVYARTKISIRDIYKEEKTEKPVLIVLPGLGKFGSATEVLDSSGLRKYLELQNSRKVIILGICLGMQLFGESSDESPNAVGLNFVNAKTKKLVPIHNDARVPNIGWNVLDICKESPFSSLGTQKDFYFVHSFHMEVASEESILTNTKYEDGKFVSSIFHDNIIGFQFHPEKSGVIGQKLIKEVVDYACKN